MTYLHPNIWHTSLVENACCHLIHFRIKYEKNVTMQNKSRSYVILICEKRIYILCNLCVNISCICIISWVNTIVFNVLWDFPRNPFLFGFVNRVRVRIHFSGRLNFCLVHQLQMSTDLCMVDKCHVSSTLWLVFSFVQML